MCLDTGAYFTPTLSIVQNDWHFAEHPELLEDPAARRLQPGCAGPLGRPGAPGGGSVFDVAGAVLDVA